MTEMTSISETTKTLLKKHGYHLAGTHGAVKTCLWLNKSLRNDGACYKSKFYGMTSHRCIQMTPTLVCNHRCLHCWRAVEVPVEVPPVWDLPQDIVKGVLMNTAGLFQVTAALNSWIKQGGKRLFPRSM